MSAANNISPSIEQACRAITALLTKLEHAAEKISQYKCSIGQHIVAIKKARPDDWLQIVETACGLKRRRAYSFLALVSGTETVEEQRADAVVDLGAGHQLTPGAVGDLERL